MGHRGHLHQCHEGRPTPPLLFVFRQCSHCYFLLFFVPPLPLWHFMSFLKRDFPEMPLSWLRGSAVSCGRPTGASWNVLCLAWGVLTSLQREHLCNSVHVSFWMYFIYCKINETEQINVFFKIVDQFVHCRVIKLCQDWSGRLIGQHLIMTFAFYGSFYKSI